MLIVQVEDTGGIWSTRSCGAPGQSRRELELLAERWRTSRVFGDARIRVVDERLERRAVERSAAALDEVGMF